MTGKGQLRLLGLTGILLLDPGHLRSQPVNRTVRAVPRGEKTCIRKSDTGPHTYLNLELKISKGGTFEVTRAAEVPGSVRLNSAPTSDYIYEVRNGNETVAAAFLRDDPFAVRGFADPSSSRGEKIEREDAATIILNVPAFNLSMLGKCKLGLHLYRLQPGIRPDSIDADKLKYLREEGKLTHVISVPAPKFTEAIKKAAKARS